ncbi:LOW QUALITY PROTEIN: hypothetical protein ACHAWO_003661 [Cyclotella atomus]|uniref:Uncharacterized protein n=1 Tax=Cyclotella atomus TaxID=382360 RepID=A0ABD3N9B9_9STRA
MCAKTHFIANNRSLKVLVAMAWGLCNEVDGSPLFDEMAEPWKDQSKRNGNLTIKSWGCKSAGAGKIT